MAEKYPSSSGLWSTAANWNGGTKPQPGDTVHANNFTVTIDENATVTAVTTAAGATAVAGGGFTLNDGITLTANVIAGTTDCVTFSAASPATAAIVGNITGGASSGAEGVWVGTGSLTITGNVTGGSATSAQGVTNAGPLTITGNVIGGSVASALGVSNSTGGTVTINGNVTAGSATNAVGLNIPNTTVCTVNGDLIATTANAPAVGLSGTLMHDGDLVSGSNGKFPFNPTSTGIYLATSTNVIKLRENNAGSAGAELSFATGGGGGGASGGFIIGG